MTTPQWLAATLKVIDTFDALSIPYMICGSVASIIYGPVRTTADADLVADLKAEHAEPLTGALQAEFYIDPETILQAIKQRASFNLIHQQTMFKIDVFALKPRAFNHEEFKRRVQRIVIPDPQREAWIASAEDIVLSKLEWFRLGGEVSERQWRDVLGILKIQRDRLDAGYMQQTAISLNVSDLLDRAWHEAEK